MRKQVPKLKEPNALNFFKIRKAEILPPYFECITIPYTYNIEESLNKWITKNLKGRFFIGKAVEVSNNNTMETVMKVGFEEGKELAFFMLACPLLKYK
jgi:hypothetical protein